MHFTTRPHPVDWFRLVILLALARDCAFAADPPTDPAAPKTPSVFQWPALHDACQTLMAEGLALAKRGELERAETLMRSAVARGGFLPATHYNLGCILALRGQTDEAFAALTRAVETGWDDAEHLRRDEDLTRLRDDPRFARVLEQATERRKQPVADIEPRVIEEGIAWVSHRNARWDAGLNVVRTQFRPAEWPETPAVIRGHGAVGDKLRQWFADGTAAGHRGDLYDNCDRDHSNMSYADFPQLARIEYAKEDGVAAPFGLQVTLLHGVLDGEKPLGGVLGNSSTAQVGSPLWRSNPRAAYVSPRGANLLHTQYRANHLYFYPEHRDHDPSPAERAPSASKGENDGQGDVYPANTPYLIVSQGSSGSDVPFMNAVACTLAAFRPDVKQALVAQGLLMPTVQMIFRQSNKQVVAPEDYLTGAAHPSAFESGQLNVERMIDRAHDVTLDALPPLVQLRVAEEDAVVVGRDCFDVADRERLFDTPSAIARVHRTLKYRRRMVVSAEDSRDPNGRPLTFRWTVLRGDAELIRIRPRNNKASVVELSIPYHARGPVQPGSKLESNRVDIGVFAHNGVHYSAPAFMTVYSLDNERREYDRELIRAVTYTGGTDPGNYVDPVLDLPKSWRDEYHYDEQDRLLGWTRIRGEKKEEFTADGDLIVRRDDAGQPVEVRKVRYVAQPRPNRPPMLVQETVAEPNATNAPK